MKKCTLLSIAFLCYFFTANAKIWRVNNMPGVTADFTTAQAAHNGASAGDTIHLEPSVNNYGTVICTKQLVWLSIGTFLTQNPGKQYAPTQSTMSTITANAGSEGSVFSVVTDAAININVPNITITRTYILGIISIGGPATNCIVTQSYCNYVFIGSTGAIISNNIMAASVIMGGNTTSAIITNNVLNISTPNQNFVGTATYYNSVYQNNISIRGGPISFNNCTQSHNMYATAELPAGTGNQLSVNMANVFVNHPSLVDNGFQLKVGSPAIGAGNGGVDMGAFGGSNPFVLALQPAIPAITNMSTPASTGGTTIQVTFSAKSNN